MSFYRKTIWKLHFFFKNWNEQIMKTVWNRQSSRKEDEKMSENLLEKIIDEKFRELFCKKLGYLLQQTGNRKSKRWSKKSAWAVGMVVVVVMNASKWLELEQRLKCSNLILSKKIKLIEFLLIIENLKRIKTLWFNQRSWNEIILWNQIVLCGYKMTNCN